MADVIMNESIFFINLRGDIASINLGKDDWVWDNEVSTDILLATKNTKVNVIFIGKGNIFSHSMNVLRNAINGSPIIAVIGIGTLSERLLKSRECSIVFSSNTIVLDGTCFKFRDFDFIRDTSEVIEYNLNKAEICYKPDYYYSETLSHIVVDGYNEAASYLPKSHTSRFDVDYRVWDKGFVFPKEIYLYFRKNKNQYYEDLLKYVDILKAIYSSVNIGDLSNGETKELQMLLKKHYSYSILFSFLTPHISEEIVNTLGQDVHERVYTYFILNSPIVDKEKLTENALFNICLFLNNIKDGIDYKSNYMIIYGIDDRILVEDACVMYFVTNMLSDIRRCVINHLILHNSWFKSICKHRESPSIY